MIIVVADVKRSRNPRPFVHSLVSVVSSVVYIALLQTSINGAFNRQMANRQRVHSSMSVSMNMYETPSGHLIVTPILIISFKALCRSLSLQPLTPIRISAQRAVASGCCFGAAFARLTRSVKREGARCGDWKEKI